MPNPPICLNVLFDIIYLMRLMCSLIHGLYRYPQACVKDKQLGINLDSRQE